MLSPEKIQSGLGDADMALDADHDGGQRAGGVERVEDLFNFRGAREISLNS